MSRIASWPRWRDCPRKVIELSRSRTAGLLKAAYEFDLPASSVACSAYAQGFADCFDVMSDQVPAPIDPLRYGE